MPLVDALFAALLIAFRIVVPGWGLLVLRDSEEQSHVSRVGSIVFGGVCANLLVALFLAVLSLWNVATDWALWGLTSAAVLAFSWKQKRRSPPPSWAFLFVLISTAVVLLLPPRSEWLAGGWDPGIYQNNAQVIARTNGLGGQSDRVFADLSPEEIQLFSTTEGAYREVLPGVPVDEASGHIPLYFFHLSPLMGAWVLRLAGLAGLVRIPILLGVWMAPALVGLFENWGFRKQSFWGLLFWWLCPLWLYHLAIPTSELLYIFLLTGALAQLASSEKKDWRVALSLGVVLFLATVNHFNFPIVAGVILCAFAWSNTEAKDRGTRHFLLAGFAGLWIGVLFDLAFAEVTLDRLQEKDNAVKLVLTALGLLTAVGGVLSLVRIPPSVFRWSNRIFQVTFLVAGVSLILVAIVHLHPGITHRVFARVESGGMLFRILSFSRFCGPGPLFASGVGLGLLAWHGDKSPWVLRTAMLALLALLALFVFQPGISPIYPWALRRYLAVSLPIFAGATFFAFTYLATLVERPWIKISGILLLSAGLAVSYPVSRKAMKVGDYVGIRGLIDAVSAELRPGDIVVADDARWGTPLFLGRGINVLDGKRIWENRDPERRAAQLAVLSRLEQSGNRIVWLTSTPSTIGLYPEELPVRETLLEDWKLTYRVIIHSQNANCYARNTITQPFGLFVVELPPQ